MTCAFDLDHYRDLLQAAQRGGYTFARFDRDPQPGDLFLRHDVDLSLEAAIAMAELERELGVTATYFLMTESVFYNLASGPGEEMLAQLRALDHAVGLHGVYPRAEPDPRLDPVLAWHNPDPDYMSEPVDGFVNVMEVPWFDRERYRSDSNQRWRGDCPHKSLAKGKPDWLQLLIHPEIWVYEGATMRESMHSMLDARRELELQQLADDRIDLS
jgi:hypothetical protein